MFLHTVPINVGHFEKAFPQLERLWEALMFAYPDMDLNYVKGGMLVHVRTFGTVPPQRTIEKWVNTERAALAPSAWVTIRVILELNGYKVQYPKRLGGKYSSKQYHPLRRFPWAFNLEVSQQQLDWLRQNGWIITKE